MANKPKAPHIPFAAPDWPAARGVEMVKLSKITPHPKNPRTHPDAQLVNLGEAFDEFGVVVPPIVDENYRLMAGEGRWLAAQKKGFEELPVIVVRGWKESKKLRFMIADNRLQQLAGYDDMAYRSALLAIQKEGLPLGALGLDEVALATLLKEVEAPAEFTSFGEDIETEHECPKCRYRWSGKPTPESDGDRPAKKAKGRNKK